MAGFTSYAETVSVYGTEKAFVDGDDTPWSKAFLAAAYASRGIKMRCTSGGRRGASDGLPRSQVAALPRSALPLPAARHGRAQGTQNGGIDGAPLASTIPGGVRELMAENLLAVWLDLECASGNDARTSESEIRIGAKILPYLIAGSDLICSGFGSIKKYDNSFNPSLFNGEELEDYLVLQRDFEADGGLTPLDPDMALDRRRRAVDALAAVFEELDLGRVTDGDEAERRLRLGLRRHRELRAARRGAGQRSSIEARGLTVLDVVKALEPCGVSARRRSTCSSSSSCAFSGDYLQTSACVRGGRVLSAVNDPNDYAGPGTGYRMAPATASAEINAIRDVLDRETRTGRRRRRGTGPAPGVPAGRAPVAVV